MNKYIKDTTDYSNYRYRIKMNKLISSNYEMPNNEELLQILNGGIIISNNLLIKIYQLESDYQNSYTFFEYSTPKKKYKALYWTDYNKHPQLVADTKLGNFDNNLIQPVSHKYKNKSRGRSRILMI
ncbi:MAG: hypothetical protein VZS44_03385 [Bacilli bacterium]|nr:hypothetical protein [Bacilli bacterium]